MHVQAHSFILGNDQTGDIYDLHPAWMRNRVHTWHRRTYEMIKCMTQPQKSHDSPSGFSRRPLETWLLREKQSLV